MTANNKLSTLSQSSKGARRTGAAYKLLPHNATSKTGPGGITECPSPKAREKMIMFRVESMVYTTSAWPRSDHDSTINYCRRVGQV